MKHIYDMAALMHRTGITDYVELQKQGYDVIFYLKEKQKILQSQVEELQQEIDQIESNSKKIKTGFLGDSVPSFCELFEASLRSAEDKYSKEDDDSTYDSSSEDDSSCDSSYDDDFGPNMGFDESRISEPGYCYIGT